MPPFLTDLQFSLLSSLFPPELTLHSSTASMPRGRPPHDSRLLLDALLWKLSLQLPWDLLPAGFPSSPTVYRRYRLWQHSGLLRQVLVLLIRDLIQRGGFDPRQAVTGGLVRINRRGRSWQVEFDPTLAGTWQERTARLFYLVALGHPNLLH